MVESSGRTEVINYNDGPGGHSYGECQVQYPTARELGYARDIYCSEKSKAPKKCGLLKRSKEYGSKYLSKQLKRYNGDWTKAISAYNAGSYTKKNRKYVQKVIRQIKVQHIIADRTN